MTDSTPPPGNRGLPLIGETLDFLKGPGPFVSERFEAHGCPFRSNIIFKQTVFLRGGEGAAVFLNDDLVSKVDSVPPPIMALFSGDGLVNMIDGDAHRVRKELLLAAFDEETCATYVPALEAVCARYLERWVGSDKPIVADLKALCIEAICTTIFGISDPGELAAIESETVAVIDALTALPIKLPGTAYSRGVKAVGRIVEGYTARVRASGPDDTHGVAKLLAARTADGQSLSPEIIARELHHAVLAGFIAFAELSALMVQLNAHPLVRDRVVAELVDNGQVSALDGGVLTGLPYLDQVVHETKRVTPNVPVAFWTAKKAFEFQGKTIEKGWGLVLCTTETSNLEEHWASPSSFDPDRFGAERAEMAKCPHAFAPQGVGPMTGHKCLGFHFSSALMAVFTALLCRDYTWEIPEQDLSLKMELIPPEPQSGLRIRLAKK